MFVVVLFAAMVYLLVRVLDRRRGLSRPAPRRAPDTRRTVAPDDDDQFLRDIDRDLDKKRKEQNPPD